MTRLVLNQVISIKHGFAFKSEFFSDDPKASQYIVLTPGNFIEKGGFRLRPEKERYYTGEIPTGYVLQENDVIVAMTEQAEGLLGCSALIPENERFLHNQRLGLIQVKEPSKVDKKYLYHLFNTYPVRQKIAGSASGTKIRHTSPERICRVEHDFPPLPVQKKIADVLSAYDDLIEVNRRSIQLLEDSARRIYKEWFVQFRFPDHEKVKMVDGLPDGWKRVPYGEISIEIRDSVDPKDIDPTTPYLGLEHLPRKSITLSDWDYPDKVESHKFRFLKDDILFGKIRPYFHKVGFGLTDGITSSDAVVIRAKNKELQTLLLLCTSSDDFVAFATQTSKEGSKMPRADWDKIRKDFLVNLPSQDIVGLFNQTINPMLAQLRNLALEARSLSEARDRILPRLMSGKIDLGA